MNRPVKRRWIFPLALEPIALEPNEVELRRPDEPTPPADDSRPIPTDASGAKRSGPGPGRGGRWWQAIVAAWRSHRRARMRSRAMRVAMWRFGRLHPHWYDAMFDASFLRRFPAGSVADMEASALAREWTRQFRYHDVRRIERDARLVTPVAESFLALLQDAQGEEACAQCAAHGAPMARRRRIAGRVEA